MNKSKGPIKTNEIVDFLAGDHLLLRIAHPDPTDDYTIQFLRSFIVSLVAVVVNFGGSFLFKEVLGIYYLLSATLSFFLGVLVNYYLSVKWVFATRKLTAKHVEFFVFVVITAIGLAFNLLIIAGMVKIVKASYWEGLVVATVIVFFWNFLARKKILY